MFETLVQYGGIAFALVCVALLAILRGDVVTRGSYDAMVKEKDRQITREQERSSDLWTIVRPSILVGQKALDKIQAGGEAR